KRALAPEGPLFGPPVALPRCRAAPDPVASLPGDPVALIAVGMVNVPAAGSAEVDPGPVTAVLSVGGRTVETGQGAVSGRDVPGVPDPASVSALGIPLVR